MHMTSGLVDITVVDDAGPDRAWLTFVHGFTQHQGVFSAQVQAFRSRYRLLLVDLPGHGTAAGHPGPYGPSEYTGHVSRALETAGVESTHFWGTHTGAGIGLLLAARHPARIRSLVLEGAVVLGRQPASVQGTLARVRAIAASAGMDAALRVWLEEAAWFEVMRRTPEACRWDAHRAIVGAFPGAPWLDPRPGQPVEDVTERLGAVIGPVLLVNGEHDLPDFLATAASLHAGLPQARRVLIPGGGGFPGWEFPERVNAVAGGFLAETDASADSPG
jgi:pimeloyl-ACP methyl ester carboxylesterase